MQRPDIPPKLTELVTRLSDQATKARRKLRWALLLGWLASAVIAAMVFSPEASVTRNATLCIAIAIPALVWLFIWFILGQLADLPSVIKEFGQQHGLVDNIQQLRSAPASGVRGIYQTLKILRQAGGLSDVVEAVGGAALLVNPLFAVVALIAALIMVLMVPVAALLLIF